MEQKLHAAEDVQILVNAVMPWAEARLRQAGGIGAAAAWLVEGSMEPHFKVFDEEAGAEQAVPAEQEAVPTIQEQELQLTGELRSRWERGELAAVALVAPVLYGRSGSGERSLAVRLHVESRVGENRRGEKRAGYCADIFMPYRIRASHSWRGEARNRVHFSHPVAQESEPRFGGSPQDEDSQGPAQKPRPGTGEQQ